MYVVIFFTLVMATVGTRQTDHRSTMWGIAVLSALCCALFYMQRFG